MKLIITKYIIIIVVVVSLVVSLFTFFSTVPLGIITMIGDNTESKFTKSENTLKESIKNDYNNAKGQSETLEAIVEYINNNYGTKGTINDIYGSAYITDKCYINIYYEDNLNAMIPCINAYMYAVNGIISYFGLINEATATDEQSIFVRSEEEVDFFDGIGFDDVFKSAYVSSDLAKYFDNNKLNKNNFITDNDFAHWKINISVSKKKTNRTAYNTGLSGLYYSNILLLKPVLPPITDEPDPEPVPTPEPTPEPVPVYEDYYTGSIVIPMYYDMSSFKSDKIMELLANDKDGDLANAMYNVLNVYYDNYFVISGRTDNRNEIFAEMLADGTMMYVPIAGYQEAFYGGGLGKDGIVNAGIDGKSSIEIWRTIEAMRNAGLLTKRVYSYQCTSFATYWFYLIYHVKFDNSGHYLYGNGNQMAYVLVRDHPDKFYMSSQACAGAVYSIGGNSGGKTGNHVGCVDAVDYQNKTITISEGNVFTKKGNYNTERAGMRVKYTMTFDQFNSYWRSIGDWIQFACPITD